MISNRKEHITIYDRTLCSMVDDEKEWSMIYGGKECMVERSVYIMIYDGKECGMIYGGKQ